MKPPSEYGRLRKISVSNIVAVLTALWIGATCSGCSFNSGAEVLTSPSAAKDSIARLAATDSVVLVISPKRVRPTDLHAAVWRMVCGCLGLPPLPLSVQWVVADSIVGDPSGVLSYGIMVRHTDAPATVIVERARWFDPSVLSHELIHYVAGVGERDPMMGLCTMFTGTRLPLRQVPARALPSIRERAATLRREGADAPQAVVRR